LVGSVYRSALSLHADNQTGKQHGGANHVQEKVTLDSLSIHLPYRLPWRPGPPSCLQVEALPPCRCWMSVAHVRGMRDCRIRPCRMPFTICGASHIQAAIGGGPPWRSAPRSSGLNLFHETSIPALSPVTGSRVVGFDSKFATLL
jgi:hypothetical protein